MPSIHSSKSYKHQDLYQYMMHRIRDGIYRPGELVDSEHALCMRLKLSRNTVRQTFAQLELEGYLIRRQGKGTFLSENANRISRKIALVVTDLEQIGNPVTANMLRGLKNVLAPAGYTMDLLAGDLTFNEDDIRRLNREYSGLLLGATQIDQPAIRALERSSIPFFFIKNYPDNCSQMAMRIDYALVGYMAAEHLIGSGHRNLAIIGATEQSTIGKDFITGVKNACLEYGARLGHENIFPCGYTCTDAVQQAVQAILAHKDRPDGIIAGCDEIAIYIMRELKAAGVSIPKDIALIGCNDIDVAPLTSPSLSSIHLPMTRLGEESADIMLQILHGKKYAFMALKPELRVRESSV